MRYPSISRFLDPDPHTRATLEAELARGPPNPELQALLRRKSPDLWRCFARYYDYLTRLPRRVRRALQREWKRSLSGVALLLALGQAPALAATITVTGTCTLVDAITAANTDIATGGCPAGRGADVIVLTEDVTLTAVDNTTDSPNGLPSVTSPITINGNTHTLQRSAVSGTPDFRLSHVAYSGNLTLKEITLSNGRADYGGGVVNDGGMLTLTKSTVLGNNASVSGGGVAVGGRGTLLLTNSTVSGNTAGFGGGVSSFGATATLTNSTISGNSATVRGGGVEVGVGGTLRLTNSTVSGNSSDDRGGGVSSGYGTLTLTNSTISGNSASGAGGGVNAGAYGVPVTVNLTSSLVSGNTAPDGAEVFSSNPSYYSINANDYNLFGHAVVTDADAFVGFVPGANDINATSDGTNTPLADILAALRDNGGPTRTHALVAGSPAVDGVARRCPPPRTDQRGFRRPVDGHGDHVPKCDIGAFEFRSRKRPK